MQEKSDYLFVYSSLRKGFHSEGYQYVTKYFTFLCNASVPGALKDAGREPVGVPSGDHTLRGELYRLKDSREFSYVFGQLDEYEGLAPEQGETKLYRRELTRATRQDGDIVNAWVYWYNLPTDTFPLIASGDVRDYRP